MEVEGKQKTKVEKTQNTKKRGMEYLGGGEMEDLGREEMEYLKKKGMEYLGGEEMEYLGREEVEYLKKRGM